MSRSGRCRREVVSVLRLVALAPLFAGGCTTTAAASADGSDAAPVGGLATAYALEHTAYGFPAYAVVGFQQRSPPPPAGDKPQPPPTPAGCDLLASWLVHDPWHAAPYGEVVWHCRGEPPVASAAAALQAAPLLPPNAHVLCMPSPCTWGPCDLHRQWIRDWAGAWARLGVAHAFLYAAHNADPEADPYVAGFAYSWLRFKQLDGKLSFYNSQMWAVHDCLYRARSAGAEWALFLDLDELLVLNGAARSLPELTAGLEARGVACASLGSVPYNTLECGASAASPLPDRFVWRAQEPECVRGVWTANVPAGLCPGSFGRRKVLCRPANVTALEVHQISVGPPLEALDASTGPYLMHARRVNYDRKDLPQPCAGAGDRCTLVGGGGSHEAVLNCTGGDGGDSIGITSTFVRAGRA